MASIVFNRGIRLKEARSCGRRSLPSKFKVALLTEDYTPDVDDATWGDVSAFEIAAGGGYAAGGIDLEASSTGFTADSQDDSADTAQVTLKDLVFTAVGDTIPVSGGGARYAVVYDFNATPANGELGYLFDLTDPKFSDVSITLSGFKSRGTH